MPRSGVSYAPEAEWSMAAVWAGYRPDDEDFFSMDGDDQARIVALYRLSNQIEAVMAQEQIRKMRQKKHTG